MDPRSDLITKGNFGQVCDSRAMNSIVSEANDVDRLAERLGSDGLRVRHLGNDG